MPPDVVRDTSHPCGNALGLGSACRRRRQRRADSRLPCAGLGAVRARVGTHGALACRLLSHRTTPARQGAETTVDILARSFIVLAASMIPFRVIGRVALAP